MPKVTDSGIECLPAGQAGLGEIPAHWEVKRLKYVAIANPTWIQGSNATKR